MKRLYTDKFDEEDYANIGGYLQQQNARILKNQSYIDASASVSRTDAITPYNQQAMDNTKPAIKQPQSAVNLYSGEYAGMIEAASKESGLDTNFIAGVTKQESQFNPHARSNAGAVGLMQLTPITIREIKRLTGKDIDPNDPQQNLTGGSMYMSHLLKKYNGDKSMALAAYNAGPGNVAKYKGIPPFKETQDYVKTVMGNYDHYNKGGK